MPETDSTITSQLLCTMPETDSAITSQLLCTTNMKREGHQNVSAALESSTNKTGQGASQTNYIVAAHTFILSVIAILGFCIPLKFPNESPYATAYGARLMNVFIIETCTYIISLIVMAVSTRRNNADLEDLMNKICLFFGTLPVILELLVLIEPFGWFISIIWSICFLCFVYTYHQSLLALSKSAVAYIVHAVREFRQTLKDWNSRRRIGNDESENMSISNGEGDIELQPQNLNHTSVTEHVIFNT